MLKVMIRNISRMSDTRPQSRFDLGELRLLVRPDTVLRWAL